MTIETLLSALKPGQKITVAKKPFTVLQHIVWWQAKCNENYDKYVLQDETGDHDYRLFISGDAIGMSHVFHYPFQEPLPKILEFRDKKYRLIQDEFCVVKKAEGQGFYKMGEAEFWWDYSPIGGRGKGLSLGRSWETWEREDLETEEVSPDEIKLVK